MQVPRVCRHQPTGSTEHQWGSASRDRAPRSPDEAEGRARLGLRDETAQSTVEYALVLLGAAALALLLVSWVTGTDVVGRLFDAVFSRILGQAG